ncbi:MAG: hypothetical protein IJZ79_02675 [Bacilli bacterium]|jgi:hypothetical protein|nr:hypothetical protein [Bacilli bacterium]MBQ8218629.1 hypothetical protein [Bacilli bacterium]
MSYILQYLPIIIATASSPTTSTFMDKVLGWAAGIGGAIIAIFLIVSLVKDGIEFAKGQGSVSIWKILGKAIFLILIIGLVFLATNYKTLGNTAKGIGDKAINTVNNEINVILP